MSVEKRVRNGKESWLVRWREDGRQRSKSCATRKEAREFEATVVTDNAYGAFAAVRPSDVRLEDWAAEWQRRYGPQWEEHTRNNYRLQLGAHVLGALGKRKLSELHPGALKTWHSSLLAAGKSAHTANRALAVLSACLGAAANDNLLPYNPCTRVKRARYTQPERPAPTPVIIEKIRAHLLAEDVPAHREATLVSVMAYGGLRPSEAIALKRGDVGRGTLRVERSATRRRQLKETKTGRARTVKIGAALQADLDAWLAASPGSEDDFLFARRRVTSDVDPNTPLSYENVWKKHLRPALLAVGVRRGYDLRHGFASLLAHEGRSVKHLQTQLGHAKASTTLDVYVHEIDDEDVTHLVPMDDAIRAARELVGNESVTGNVIPFRKRLG